MRREGLRRTSPRCQSLVRSAPNAPVQFVTQTRAITTGADYHRRPERPRSPCADTTDTHTFAKHNSATRANFGQSTSACRIENRTEQKRAARFAFVRPFGPPNGGGIVTTLALKTRWELLWIAGGDRGQRGEAAATRVDRGQQPPDTSGSGGSSVQ
jgi:hypothetical protein